MSFNCLRHQIWGAAIVLAMLTMCRHVCGRPELGAYAPLYITRQSPIPSVGQGPSQQQLQVQAQRQGQDVHTSAQALLNELLRKYGRQPPNYISRWPALRDLLLTSDYEDGNDVESEELANARFIERLRQLAATTIDLEDIRDENKLGGNIESMTGDSANNAGSAIITNTLPTPLPSVAFKGNSRLSFKEHDTKKNAQMYMSPCHFKICNMGRKRNAHFLSNF